MFHWKSDKEKPIRSDAGRERAAAQVEFLQAAISKVAQAKSTRRSDSMAGKIEAALYARQDQIREYDALKRGDLTLPKLDRLDQVAACIARIRIARGVSQTELARRVGVSKQVISRYEESDYQTVGLSRLQEILDALEVKPLIDVKL